MIGAQLAAPFRAFAALRVVPRGARPLLLLYLGLAALVFTAVGWGMTVGRPALTQAALRYVFPAEWLPWVEPLMRGLAESQADLVFVNATLMTGVACVAALLFPLKERLSRAFEAGQTWAPPGPVAELPLAFQVFEETRLFLVYVSLQLTFFWIGLSADPTRRAVATALSTVFLWAQFGLDFGAPALQRRGGRYADIVRAFVRRPLAVLGFGALLSAPAQLAGLALARGAAEAPVRALAIVFAVTLAVLPAAVFAGTRLAADFVQPDPAPLGVAPLRGLRRVAGHVAVLALVVVNLASAGLALRTLHHMSQVLKCQYDVVPDSWRVRTGLLDPLLTERVDVDASIEVDVFNPTPFDLDLRHLALDIRHRGETLATPTFGGLTVPAGARRRERVTLKIPVALSTLGRGLALFEPGWEVRLRLRVLPGTELPLTLLRPPVDTSGRPADAR